MTARNVEQPHSANRRRRFRRQRRGVTIVVVLAVISVSLALSYAMLRTQGAALQIQQNSRRLSDARTAALSGMAAAIGAMHRNDWKGIDVPLAHSLGSEGSYDVTFQAGDPRMKPGDADYADWPYRVTATVTGYASGEGGGVSTHRIRAVLRLQPQRLNTAPQVWAKMLPYTVYHASTNSFTMQTPARIEGAAYINGRLSLCRSYPSYDEACDRYLYDLHRISQLSGRQDDRPFTGPIDWRNVQTGSTIRHVTQLLGVTARTFSSYNVNDFSTQQNIDQYQLYAGGPKYDIPRLGAILENTTLAADPKTNPLGLFYRDGGIELRDNVKVNGTLLATGDVQITGQNVRLSSAKLRGVGQSAAPTRFPALLALDDVRLGSYCDVRIDGAVVAGDVFQVREGAGSISIEITGRVIAGTVDIEGRWNWLELTVSWKVLYDAFRLQLALDSVTGIRYFPDFVALLGLSSTPRIVIKPAATEVLDHWQSVDGPVYVPASTSDGMKWDIIDWTDLSTAPAP